MDRFLPKGPGNGGRESNNEPRYTVKYRSRERYSPLQMGRMKPMFKKKYCFIVLNAIVTCPNEQKCPLTNYNK
jgi:hypothetical protein